MDAIVIDSLTKKYKSVTAVDALSLRISEGELFSLLGVNGAGKSTTIKMLSCLSRPTGGDAYLYGKSIVSDADEIKGFIAVSPQESAVAPSLSVRENLSLICGVHGIRGSERESRITDISASLGLTEVLERKAKALSGGFLRRTSIAMALITKPRILFLDEPTLGLDVIARSELWELIRSLKGKVTVILTTHYMEEAEALSDRIGIMKDGRLLICDNADAIKRRAETDSFEQAFIRTVKGEVK